LKGNSDNWRTSTDGKLFDINARGCGERMREQETYAAEEQMRPGRG